MPRKKRARSHQPVQLSFATISSEWDLSSGLCRHINRHYNGPGRCVCTLPKGHDGYHQGDYIDGHGEKMHGTWSDAAGEPVKEKQ